MGVNVWWYAICWEVAQLAERRSLKPEVTGSFPVFPAKVLGDSITGNAPAFESEKWGIVTLSPSQVVCGCISTVDSLLAKQEVMGSSPITRSTLKGRKP